MIRNVTALILCGFFSGVAASQTATPPHSLDGVWQTGARGGSWGYVTFAPCGDAYCGTLAGAGGQNVDPQYFGTVMVTGMRWTGSGLTDGQLLDVETGWVYLSRLRFRWADQLRVFGCVLGGLIWGGLWWTCTQ